MYRAVQLLDKSGNKCFASPYWPIGSIYLSFNDTNPATFFGGTWERLTGGFLYGCVNNSGTGNGTGTSTGASSGNTGSYSGTSGSTAITVDQMPSHTHTQNSHKHHGLRHGDSSSAVDTCVVSTTYNGDGCIELGWSRSSTGYPYDNVSTRAATATNKNTGGGKGHTHSIPSHTHSLNAHTHIVPYIAVFAWRRIA